MTHPIFGCRPLHAPVVCSGRLLSFWYRRFNELVWHGALPHTRCVAGRLPADRLAQFDPNNATITLDPRRHPTRYAVYGSLLHEMIHAAQFHHGDPLTHGQAFQVSAQHIHLLTGIKP